MPHICADEIAALVAALPLFGFFLVYLRRARAVLQRAWWFLRGVGGSAYRALCCRCGYTGQLHYSWRSVRRCFRFKGD